MKTEYILSKASLPSVELPKALKKEGFYKNEAGQLVKALHGPAIPAYKYVMYKGYTWVYEGKSKKEHGLNCCQRFGRLLMIALRVLGLLCSLGLAAISKKFRKDFARDAKELTTGKEAVKYFSAIHKGTHWQNLTLHTNLDKVLPEAKTLLEKCGRFPLNYAVNPAKVDIKITDIDDKVIFKKIVVDLPKNNIKADFKRRIDKAFQEAFKDIHMEVSLIKKLFFVGGCFVPQGFGKMFEKSVTFKDSTVVRGSSTFSPNSLVADYKKSLTAAEFPVSNAM